MTGTDEDASQKEHDGAGDHAPEKGGKSEAEESKDEDSTTTAEDDAKAAGKAKRREGRRATLRLVGTILGMAIALSTFVIGIMAVKTGGRLLDPVAATYGQDGIIYEDDVTSYIQAQRKALGLDGEEDWKAYLEYSETTPEKVRQGIIETFVQRKLLDDYAKQKKVTVSDDEVTSDIENTKGALGLTDDAWEERLSKMGYDDDMYRTETYYSLLTDKVTKETTTISDGNLASDALLRYISAYPLDGVTNIDAIVMRTDEKDEADKIAEELKNDPSKFDDEKKEHSETDKMDGWSVTNSSAKELAAYVTDIQPGGISGAIEGSTVVAIVRVNQRLENMPTDTLDGIPQDVVDGIREMLAESGRREKFQEEMAKRLKQSYVQIRDMPEGLPYAIPDDSLNENANGNENGNVERMAANADTNENTGDGSNADTTASGNE